MDANALVAIVERLVERAKAGPLADQRRIVANLRYILENLESMHQRHGKAKTSEWEESLRQRLLQGVDRLYGGLEELEHGLLDGDVGRLENSLAVVREAASALSSLQDLLEDESAVSLETL